MLIICSVAVDFVRSDGEKYSVTGKELGIIKDAPEWIKDTLMFKWLDKDGSIKFVTQNNRIQAENAPFEGINAEGKEIHKVDEPDVHVEESEEKPKRKTTRKKTEKKDDAE